MITLSHCDSDDGSRVCRHLRRWGGDRYDRRRWLCVRDGARHEWEVHRDDHDRPVSRADCDGYGQENSSGHGGCTR